MSSREKILDLITSKQKQPTGTNNKTLYIGGGKDNPTISCLEYIGQGKAPKNSIVFNKDKTSARPLLCTELNNRLKNRFWNRVDGCRYLDSDGNLYYRTYSFNSVGDLNDNQDVVVNSDYDILEENLYKDNKFITGERLFKINDSLYSGADNEYIDSEFQKYFGNGNQIDIRDICLGSSDDPVITINTTIDLIREDSTSYTDTVDFNPIITKSNIPNLKLSAELTVKYSIDGKVYSFDALIPILSIDGNNRTILNTVEEFGKVSLEYISGVVKAIPTDTKVDECIISRCSLIYDNE